MIINSTQSIGEIVAMLPKASEVFKKYNIDFCCGGHRPLAEAIREQRLSEQEVLEKLDAVYAETKNLKSMVDFREMKSSQLIDYIVSTHHAYMKKVLPETSQLSAKILRVHGPNHSELFQIHKLFNTLKIELEMHLVKEEEMLFPLIKQHEETPSDALLMEINKVMKETEDEHEGAGDILKELRKVTQDYLVPDDGCSTFDLAYSNMKEIESDLFQHIHLENNILFKRYGKIERN